jgi:cysteinyl-tRNA synthetase
MKSNHLNIIFLVLICWAFAGCKTSQKFAQQTKIVEKTETAAEQQTQTSVVKDLNVLKILNETLEIEGTVWSAPDSTGTQHPQITFKGKKSSQANIQEQSSENSLQVENTKTTEKSEVVAEQKTSLKTKSWTLGDTVRLSITGLVMVFLLIIYFKFFKK